MLLHVGQKSDEAIRLFFVDVHELFLKVRLWLYFPSILVY